MEEKKKKKKNVWRDSEEDTQKTEKVEKNVTRERAKTRRKT